MSKIQYLFVCGDIHAEWGKFNIFLNKIRQNKKIRNDINNGNDVEVIVLQVGDFGWWPHFHGRKFSSKDSNNFDQFGIKNEFIGIKNDRIKIIWCPGNHENHDDLESIEKNATDRFIELMPNVFYATFGSIYKLNNGKKIMFCGGASSIDKNFRIPGESWWAGETISESDMMKLPEIQKIDIIISHTCPTKFNKMMNFSVYYDCSQKALDYIFENYKPNLWFFGHFHCYNKMIIDNCVATVLSNCESYQRFYEFIERIEN